jgi:hypothetical protein
MARVAVSGVVSGKQSSSQPPGREQHPPQKQRHCRRTPILILLLLFLSASLFLIVVIPRAPTAALAAAAPATGDESRRSLESLSTEPSSADDAEEADGYGDHDDEGLDTEPYACDASMALRAQAGAGAMAAAAATSPCVPLAALRFQTPAAAFAHRYAQRRPETALLRGRANKALSPASASSSSSHPAACSAEMCSLDAPAGSLAAAGPAARSQGRPSVAARATPPKMGAVAAQQAKLAAMGGKKRAWYEEHGDVWTELTSEEDFYSFLDGQGGEENGGAGDDRFVLVGE